MFSSSPSDAQLFANGVANVSVLAAARVPASRILSTVTTGFGTLIEDEFVVLDTPGTVRLKRL